MVKAAGVMKDGRVIVMLGISDENIERLKRGDAMHFDAAQLSLPPDKALGAIAVFYAPTEADLVRTMHTLIGPETRVVAVPQSDGKPH